MNEEFRAVIHFCWLRQLSPQETFKEMEEAYGDACPSESLVYKWFKEFEEGRINLKDLPRQGRPLIFEKRVAVQNFIEQFPSSSCKYISMMLGMSKTTVKKILTDELHLKKLHFHWVPYALTPQQKVNRVDQSKQLLNALKSLSQFQMTKVITCDESWFFLWYLVDGIWKKSGEHIEHQKHLKNDPKIMIFTAFSILGPVLVYPMPQNVSFTSEHFATNILPLIKSEVEKLKGVSKTSKVRIHMDNAKPHNAKRTLEKLDELHFERLPQPPYSPDVSPNDFFLYGYIKEKLKGSHFTSREDLISAIVDIIQKIDKSVWISVYKEWMRRLQLVIDNNGDYVK